MLILKDNCIHRTSNHCAIIYRNFDKLQV